MRCDIGRSCPEHNPARECGCVEGETCRDCRMNPVLAILIVLEDAWREKLLRQAEGEHARADRWGKAYWAPYVEADLQHVGAWRALMPGLMA